jgi:medium-chain acyl-[acyl-carrier-protein] hydrolase
MAEIESWTDQYTVRSFQSDRYSKLWIHSIAQFLQESAWKHAEACGAGYSDLMVREKLWILSGLKIKVYHYPVWGEKIVLNTWGNNIEGLFAYRDFQILNEKNEICTAASSAWLIIDYKTHRPCRITEEFQKIPRRGVYSGSGQPGRLPALENAESIGSLTVKYSDIDIYQHVTNARYIEWCANWLPGNLWDGSEIDELEINYMSECHLRHELVFFMENREESLFRLSAKNLSNNKEVFRANIRVRKKDLKQEEPEIEKHS